MIYFILMLVSISFSQIRDNIILNLENRNYESVLNSSPQNSEEKLVFALAHMKTQKFDRALALIKQIKKPYPQGYFYVLGLVYEGYSKDENAKGIFKKSIDKNEYVYKSKIELGRIERKQNNLDEAIGYWNSVLSSPGLKSNEKSELHFLIAESLYKKHRYQDASDRTALKDAQEHLEKIKSRRFKEKAETLNEYIQKMIDGYIQPEDSKDLEISFDTEIGFMATTPLSIINWQSTSYWLSTDNFIYGGVDASLYYSPFRNKDGSLRVYFGLETDNNLLLNQTSSTGFGFFNTGIGTKFKWQTYNNLIALTVSYLLDFKYVNITSLEYLGLSHKISLLTEYLINENIYVFLDIPFELFSLKTTNFSTSISSGSKTSFGLGAYYIYDWIKLGGSFYYDIISTELISGSGYTANALISLTYWDFELGFRYKLKSLPSTTNILTESSIGVFLDYHFSGSFAMGLSVNSIANTKLNSNSLVFGFQTKLIY